MEILYYGTRIYCVDLAHMCQALLSISARGGSGDLWRCDVERIFFRLVRWQMSLVWKKVGSGRNSDVFSVSEKGKASRVVVKVSFYCATTLEKFAALARAGRLREAMAVKRQDAVSVSAAMGLIGNSMQRRKISPHFVTQYATIDCKDFYDKISGVVNRTKMSRVQRRYTNLAFLEKFDEDMTLFMTRRKLSDTTCRTLIFQVVYTLAALQRRYPGFRHNDLSTNNVLVRRTPGCRATYVVDGVAFTLASPFKAALSDYDFAHIPARMENERVTSGRYAMTADANTSYDTHFFLKSVAKCLRKSRVPETRAFLKTLALRRQDRLDVEVPSLDPLRLLRHPYFGTLKRTPSRMSTTTFAI